MIWTRPGSKNPTRYKNFKAKKWSFKIVNWSCRGFWSQPKWRKRRFEGKFVWIKWTFGEFSTAFVEKVTATSLAPTRRKIVGSVQEALNRSKILKICVSSNLNHQNFQFKRSSATNLGNFEALLLKKVKLPVSQNRLIKSDINKGFGNAIQTKIFSQVGFGWNSSKDISLYNKFYRNNVLPTIQIQVLREQKEKNKCLARITASSFTLRTRWLSSICGKKDCP